MQEVQLVEAPVQFRHVELQDKQVETETYVVDGHYDVQVWLDGMRNVDDVYGEGRQLKQELLLLLRHCLQGLEQNADTDTLLFWEIKLVL